MTVKLEDTRGCMNFIIRRTSRMIGRHYDDALRPHGLRSTQFNVLAVLAQMGPTSLSVVADVMAMERSALSRNLKPLERQGFVAIKPGTDKRTRAANVTSKGLRKLKKALPAWRSAQDELEALIGTTDAKRLVNIVAKVASRLTQV